MLAVSYSDISTGTVVLLRSSVVPPISISVPSRLREMAIEHHYYDDRAVLVAALAVGRFFEGFGDHRSREQPAKQQWSIFICSLTRSTASRAGGAAHRT
jgi:hypothetical protein